MSIGGLLKPIKSWGQNFLVVLGFAVIRQWLLKRNFEPKVRQEIDKNDADSCSGLCVLPR